MSKANYTDDLTVRGYSSEVIHESFNKLETNDRMSYLEPKVKPSTNERVFPLVADFNPGLTNIGGILNEHRHILFLDKELCKVINFSKNLASYRRAKTLKDSLIHSKLPSLNDNFNKNQSTLNQYGGCQPCEKSCVLCMNYLLKTDKAYSHQTNTKYKIKNIIDCNSRNVIYIINDNVCKISSVGYTADNMKTRFTNHKSHIKYNKLLCEVSKHFSDNLILHTLDKSSHLRYDNGLKEQIEEIIIEKVDVSEVGTDIESLRKKLKEII